jgi:tetratricopeptide (TPR) repeat protein
VADDSGSDADGWTEVGHEFLDRYEADGGERHLRLAVAAYERALSLLAAGDETWPFLSNLGNALRLAHEGFGDPDALARAVEALQIAFEQVTSGSEVRELVFDNLALVLRDRFLFERDLDDLRRAVDLHEAAVAAHGGGPERLRYLGNLGGAWWELYGATGDPETLECAVASFETIVAATPDGSVDLPMHRSNLAAALGDLYRRDGDADLLERSLRLARQAVTTTSPDLPDRPRMLSCLAELILSHYDLGDTVADLDEAVALLREALSGTDPRSARYAGWSNNLGEALLARFERTGREADLDECVEVLGHLVRPATGSDAGSDAGSDRYVSALGGALGARYLRRGDRADLDRAVQLLTTAVDSVDVGHGRASFVADRKHNLGLLLERRYAADGRAEDLTKARLLFQESLELTPPGSPAMPRRLAAVGNALRDAYHVTGEARLLDQAIDRLERALAIAGPAGLPEAGYLDSLGVALLDRSERTGSVDDVDAAVRCLRAARDATADDAEAMAAVSNNLGNALWSRHTHRPGQGDLFEALEAFERAVDRTAHASPDAATYLDNLANALGDRYLVTGDVTDLDRAVATCEQALAGLPRAAPERQRISGNLATILLTRYRDADPRSAADPSDLDRAIELLNAILAVTPAGAPLRVVSLNNLGVALKYRWQRDGRTADLDRGRDALREAGGPTGVADVRWSLAASLTLAGWARQREDRDEACDAYRAAISIGDGYLRVQVARSSTEAALRGVQAMYADAAHTFARAGHLPEAAATIERGRGVLLSRALERDRRAVELLADRQDVADLARRFSRAAARVRALAGPTEHDR